MALRQLVLSRRLDGLRTQRAEMTAREEALRARRAALETREAELTRALDEMDENATDEDRSAVEEEMAAFERDCDALEAEESEAQTQAGALDAQIEETQEALRALETRARDAVQSEPPSRADERTRKEWTNVNTRVFRNMSEQERGAFFAREDVKGFLARMREMIREKRAVSGAELTIPEIMLPLIREQVSGQSKLLGHVNLQPVAGKARANIMGTIPEAVWTEACGKLNEIALSFNNVEIDGYKVGAYIAECNAVLEDSDVGLAGKIIEALGVSIALAVDKAIVYGTGKKMPLGIVTRILQKQKPDSYPETAREWQDLSTDHVVSISAKTGSALFKEIVLASGKAKSKYARGGKIWLMSDTTRTTLVAEALTFNANGAIVAGVNEQMPVIGGQIITLDWMPDNVIVCGYGETYLMAERAGMTVAQSEHARFIEDQTVFKATARYDGQPVIPEAFALIDIAGGEPTAEAVTFAEDKANASEAV